MSIFGKIMGAIFGSKAEAAQETKTQFDKAWTSADVTLGDDLSVIRK